MQAVMYFEELRVEEGSILPLMATHDTYGISFQVDDARIDRIHMRTGVPLYDPVWHATYQVQVCVYLLFAERSPL
jgi:hypothetical protein